MQTKVGLICLLSKYKFQTYKKTPDSLKIDPTKFIMAPIEGVWLKVTYRDRLDCQLLYVYAPLNLTIVDCFEVLFHLIKYITVAHAFRVI